jgi:hypothetical protein
MGPEGWGGRWVEGRLGEGLKKKAREARSEKIFIRKVEQLCTRVVPL